VKVLLFLPVHFLTISVLSKVKLRTSSKEQFTSFLFVYLKGIDVLVSKRHAMDLCTDRGFETIRPWH
jgi:hypothetical protein